MSKAVQRLKFYLGILFFGTLFSLLCREIVIYVEAYIKQDSSPLISDSGSGSASRPGLQPPRPHRVPGLSDPTLPGDDLDPPPFSRPLPDDLPDTHPSEEQKRPSGTNDFPKPVIPAPKKPSLLRKDTLPQKPPADKPKESLPIHPESNINLALALRQTSAQEGDPVFIRIIKDKRLLELWIQPGSKGAFTPIKSYPILGMSGTLGPKLKEGDKQAPEGFYTVKHSSLNPNSNYHLAFNIGYPNNWDRSLDRTGNYIMVHGKDVSIGCFAMGDPGIEELYRIVEAYLAKAPQKHAVEVQIYPFIPTQTRILMEKKNPHHPFWCFLADAWVWTEKNRAPAPITQDGSTLHLEDSRLNPGPMGRLNYTNGQLIRLQKSGEQ